MENDLIRRRYETIARIAAFGTKHGAAFAAGSRGAALFVEARTTAKALEEAGAGKLSGAGQYHAGTETKLSAFAEVKEDLDAIRDTAVAISEAEGTPEFDEQFRLPRSSSQAALMAAARAFLKDATPHKALFVEFEMPADFLDDLAADIKAVEDAGTAQGDGLGDQVGGTANLATLSTKGMSVRKQLGAIVRNKFRADAGVLAEWESAAHFERPARGAGDDAPKPV
jgi:hypothetical protein